MTDPGKRRITVDEAQWAALQGQASQLRRLSMQTPAAPENGRAATKSHTVKKAFHQVFLSYRHNETEWQACWIAEMLNDRYGEDVVFKDFDSIKPGDDFVEVISEAVGSCEVLLALIGDQ